MGNADDSNEVAATLFVLNMVFLEGAECWLILVLIVSLRSEWEKGLSFRTNSLFEAQTVSE